MNIRAITINVFLANLLLFVTSCATKPKGPLAYVSNERDGTITVIDTGTDRVSTIKVGARPQVLERFNRPVFYWTHLAKSC